MRRRAPRQVSEALRTVLEGAAPKTPLAGVQGVWADVVGPDIAAVTEVVEEREGVLTVACEGAVWAEELALMSPRLLSALEAELGENAPSQLRFEPRS